MYGIIVGYMQKKKIVELDVPYDTFFPSVIVDDAWSK